MESEDLIQKDMNEKLIEKGKEKTYNIYILIAEISLLLTSFVFSLITKHWEESLFCSVLILRLIFLMLEKMKFKREWLDNINGLIQTKIGYVIAVIIYVFIVLFLIIDILNLSMRYNWQDFPNSCIKDGCTAVTDKLQTRSGVNLLSENKIIFIQNEEIVKQSVLDWFNTYSTINKRIDNNIIYADFKISFFGFWDSMMVKIVRENNKTIVYSFSEQIIGYYDFSVNDKRVLDLYEYLEKNLRYF